MLTLTRKVGQKILIGDDIEIIVREVRGRQVRLGIIAPAGVEVFREEVAARPAAGQSGTPESPDEPSSDDQSVDDQSADDQSPDDQSPDDSG